MLWAAACICFSGFFRSGEITVPAIRAYDPAYHLSWGDVAVNNPLEPSALQIRLKRSKCDQLGEGVDIFLGRTNNALCPVAAGLAYIAVRGSSAGAFFRFADGRPLTKARFVAHFHDALRAIGLPYGNFSGHSFRSGAATATAKAGMEDSLIRTLGRWNSAAFLTYIRTRKEDLARFTQLIASA